MTEPHVAGHSTHFLRRLERFADDHVELALTLYRDAELLAEVLRRVRLDDSAARIAIALDDDREGPFVVVTREGKFVTCLGRGMRPTGLAVLTRAQLDAASSKVERMRERIAQVRSIERDLDDSAAARMLRRLHTSGPLLAREDFEAILRWEPLFREHLWGAVATSGKTLFECYPRVAWMRADRRTSREDDLLETFWHLLWSQSHLLVLANAGAPRELLAALRDASAAAPDHVFSCMVTSMHALGLVQTSVRALWVTARLGRDLLPTAKHTRPDGMAQRIARDLTLATIAHASKSARAEATKALAAGSHGGDWWSTEARSRLLEPIGRGTERACDDHRADVLVSLHTGTLPCDEQTIARLGLRRYDTWLARLASSEHSWTQDTSWLPSITKALPELVRCDATALFPTRALCEALPVPYDPRVALELVDGMRAGLGGGRPEPARRVVVPARNERCPCGSGAKYKRCCAAPAARAA